MHNTQPSAEAARATPSPVASTQTSSSQTAQTPSPQTPSPQIEASTASGAETSAPQPSPEPDDALTAQASQSPAVMSQPEADITQPDATKPNATKPDAATVTTSEVAPVAQAEPQQTKPTQAGAPQASAYYDEELPADFWNREGASYGEGQSVPLDGGVDEVAEALPRGLAREGASPAGEPVQELRSNPTYVTMTELFPGKIVAWHDDKQKADASNSNDDSEVIANPDETLEPDPESDDDD
ncbi:MAG: hypothetical protein AAF267_07695 [Deinococcota bacterium]